MHTLFIALVCLLYSGSCHTMDNIVAIIAQYVEGKLITMPPSKEKFDPIARTIAIDTFASDDIVAARRIGPKQYEIGYKCLDGNNDKKYEPLAAVGPDKPLALSYSRGWGHRLFILKNNGIIKISNLNSEKNEHYYLAPIPRFDQTQPYKLKLTKVGLQPAQLFCYGNGKCFTQLIPLDSDDFPTQNWHEDKITDHCLQSDQIDEDHEHIQQIQIDGQWHLYHTFKNSPVPENAYGPALFKAIQEGLAGLDQKPQPQPELEEEEFFV